MQLKTSFRVAIHFLKSLCIVVFLIGAFLNANAQKKTDYKMLCDQFQNSNYQDQTLLFALKEMKETEKYYAHSRFLLGLGYAKLAYSTDLLQNSDRLKQLADSASIILNFSKTLIDETSLKKQKVFFEEYLPNLSISGDQLSVVDLEEWAKVLLEDLEGFSEHTNELLRGVDQVKLLAKNVAVYHRSIVLRYPQPMDIYMLSNDKFQILIDSIQLVDAKIKGSIKQFNLLTDVYEGNTSKLTLEATDMLNYPFPQQTVSFHSGSVVSISQFSAWIDSVKAYRKDKIYILRQAIIDTENYLNAQLKEIENDSVSLTTSFEIDSLLAKPILEKEGNSLPVLLFKYKAAKVNMLSDYLAEENFLPFEKDRNDILTYYFTLKSSSSICQRYLDEARNAATSAVIAHHSNFFERFYGGEKGLKSFLDHEQKYINEKRYYCNIKIKDQLVYSYLEQRFLPKYAEYEENQIALFEQSPSLIVEKGAYITTKVTKNADGVMYVTGFQKNAFRTPFVAKIVSRQVEWLKYLNEEEEGKPNKKYRFGTVLTPTAKGFILVLRESQRRSAIDTSATNTLYEISHGGNVISTVSLNETLMIDHSLKIEEDSSYIVAYRSKPGGKDFFPEMLVANIDLEGNTQWERRFPLESKLTRLHHVEGRYFLVSNIVNLRDSNGNLIPSNSRKGGDCNVFAAVFDKNGSLLNKKLIRSNTSHFSTYAVPYNESGLLVMGFKGEFNLNALPDNPVMDILFDKDLVILSSNLKDIELLP